MPKLGELNNSAVTIFGIESSCDDTAAAVMRNGKMLANITANQEVHKKYGGVVPELASRAHQRNIIPVVDRALEVANVLPTDIDAVAFTRGPGLLGSLLVGTSFAKAFALGLGIPLIEVNHMQAHIMAHFIEDETQTKPAFPFLCLTVSGGHTQIVLVKDHLTMNVIGQTLDDAAGEAFDKAAKILGLPYPGGPLIDKYASEGNPNAFEFAKPKVPQLDYSFSGLKTSFLYFLRDKKKEDAHFIEKNLNDLCASVQETIIGILMVKLCKAAKEMGITDIAIAGGVSANSGLRDRLEAMREHYGWKVYIPKFEYCTDNAAMIAICGHYKFLKGEFVGQDVTPFARYPIS